MDDLEKNRASFLCYLKFCASFESHLWIQTGVAVRKRLIWVKIDDFFSRVTLKFGGWPWTTESTSPIPHQALWIISSPYVNSNWSYSPETAKLDFDLCDLDHWPLTFTFCMEITSVIDNHSWKSRDDTMMGTWRKRCDSRAERRADGRTDRQTDRLNHSQSCLVAAKN